MHSILCCIIGQPFVYFWSSWLIWIRCPWSTTPLGTIPSISWHSTAHPKSVIPIIASPSIGIPKRTSISYNVIVISPCGRWKVWVSGHHHSTKAVIKLWSISLDGVLCSPSNPTLLTMSRTRSSTIGGRFRNSSLWPRHFSGPGSCTW